MAVIIRKMFEYIRSLLLKYLFDEMFRPQLWEQSQVKMFPWRIQVIIVLVLALLSDNLDRSITWSQSDFTFTWTRMVHIEMTACRSPSAANQDPRNPRYQPYNKIEANQ